MDVHRARFIPYPTPTITCLAFTRSNDDNLRGNTPALRLALARTDGSIEIWNPLDGVWVQETRFPTTSDTAVDSLVWTQEPDEVAADGEVILGQYRLFSIGSSASVTEWNLETGTIKRKSTGNVSEVWCMAAQPRSSKPSTTDSQRRAQDLVIGCGDGTLALLSTEDNDLQFKRFLARVSGKKARCLTITYQKPEKVIAGFADGMIRVFDTKNGSILRTMSLGAGLPGAPKTTLVWKLTTLPSGDFVSADSNGELRIWDGKTLSMSQRLRGHEGDCLDVVASSDGKSIFTGGVDGRIASFRQTTVDRGRSSWSKISQRKIHQEHGSVTSLAAYDGKSMSVFIAGGDVDPAPVAVPLKAYGKEHFRSLPFLPQEAQLVSAPEARLVATWWDKTIYIYKFARQNSLEVLRDDGYAVRQLLGRIELDTKDAIKAVALSPSGDLVAASTSTSTKLFQIKIPLRKTSTRSQLNAPPSVSNKSLKVRKVKLPRDMAESGAKVLAMAGEAEGTWLAAVSLENEIKVTKATWSTSADSIIEAAPMTIELDRPVRRNARQTGFKQYDTTITKLLFTNDAAMLVSADISGNLDFWELEGDFDVDQKCIQVSKQDDASDDSSDSDSDDEAEVVLYGQTWKYGASNALPRLDSAPLVLTFRPSTEQNLIDSQLGESAVLAHRKLLAITARHQIYEFDVREGVLSAWSRRNPSSSLPEEFTRILDRVIGAHWDPKERLWLYGSSFVFMLDVSNDLPTGSNKRKREGETTSSSKRNKGSGAGGAITNGYSVQGPLTATRTDEQKVTNVDLRDNGQNMDDDEDAVDLDAIRAKTAYESARIVQSSKQHWCTFKYRPILGMVALAHDQTSAVYDDETKAVDEAEDVLEVVIVERPPMPTKRKKQK